MAETGEGLLLTGSVIFYYLRIKGLQIIDTSFASPCHFCRHLYSNVITIYCCIVGSLEDESETSPPQAGRLSLLVLLLREKGNVYTGFDLGRIRAQGSSMEQIYELTALRSIREIHIAVRDLENQAAATSKRYKKGIKTLLGEVSAIEASLDDGGVIEGMEPWNIQSEQIKSLISNPVLSNIEEDNLI
tara:strand:+ start:115 stop:678 length:564 start_codon:yes stop_codon:yes gene_type:complete